MSLANLLEPRRVLANVEARSKKHALEILSELIAAGTEGHSQTDVFEALLERERIGNTGLGGGLAIPHGTVPDLTSSIGAFLKLNEAVDFDSQDGEPVHLMFGVAVPENPEANHFEDVAEVAKAFSDEALLAALKAAGSSRSLYSLLAGYEPPPAADIPPESPPDAGNGQEIAAE